MFAYVTHFNTFNFVECIKQCIKCIGEKNNLKYRSYQASIDPIPIQTLVSILSILGSIRPPLKSSANFHLWVHYFFNPYSLTT